MSGFDCAVLLMPNQMMYSSDEPVRLVLRAPGKRQKGRQLSRTAGWHRAYHYRSARFLLIPEAALLTGRWRHSLNDRNEDVLGGSASDRTHSKDAPSTRSRMLHWRSAESSLTRREDRRILL
jgi:hypothetical protein